MMEVFGKRKNNGGGKNISNCITPAFHVSFQPESRPGRFTNRDRNGKVEFACMGRVKEVSSEAKQRGRKSVEELYKRARQTVKDKGREKVSVKRV